MRSVCHSNLRSLLTHLLEGQDLIMTTEYSGAFTKLAPSSCCYLTYDIFTLSAQCSSLYVNVTMADVWCCWEIGANERKNTPNSS